MGAEFARAPDRARRADDRTPIRRAAIDPGRSPEQARTLIGIARAGLQGPGSPYPHRERIEQAFGAYAPAGLRAYVGPRTAAAADALHASGFMVGRRAGFSRAPDLRTAAHEAAHAVDQAHGRTPAGGVGAPGDRGERFAHAVADTVARGGSAEPLFAEALGPAAQGPPPSCSEALQMDNKIASYVADSKLATPWEQIKDELELDDDVFDITDAKEYSKSKQTPFASMFKELGDGCDRAHKATAKLDTPKDKGGDRKSKPPQTQYGTLGSYMEYIFGMSRLSKDYAFEGGHLISDELVGDKSYTQYNFAPQRRQINSPAYRKIEELAAAGTVPKDPTVKKKRPPWNFEVEVEYVTAPLTIDVDDLKNNLGFDDDAIGKTPVPKSITLHHRVPDLWTAKLASPDPDFVFDHETRLDEDKGAILGFQTSEADVIKNRPEATSHSSALYWGMDTMAHHVIGKSGVGTGWGLDRKSEHTFTAVQSVPVGQTKKRKLPTATLAPSAPTIFPLSKSLSWSDLDTSKYEPRKKNAKRKKRDPTPTPSSKMTGPPAKKAMKRPREELAEELLKSNPKLDTDFGALEMTLDAMTGFKHSFEQSKTATAPKSKKAKPITYDLDYAMKTIGSEVAGDDKKPVLEMAFTLLSQIKNTSGSGPFN